MFLVKSWLPIFQIYPFPLKKETLTLSEADISKPELHSEVQNIRKRFSLDPTSCWRSFFALLNVVLALILASAPLPKALPCHCTMSWPRPLHPTLLSPPPPPPPTTPHPFDIFCNFVFFLAEFLRFVAALCYFISICLHYENMPIQIYWKFYHQKVKIFR